MPRNMSFALTTAQIKNRSKTVTRRFGWWFLKPGDVLNAVEKSMGLQKGEKIKRLAKIEVLSVRKERLFFMEPSDCAKEGFPLLTPYGFVCMLRSHFGPKVQTTSYVNRIEFKYI